MVGFSCCPLKGSISSSCLVSKSKLSICSPLKFLGIYFIFFHIISVTSFFLSCHWVGKDCCDGGSCRGLQYTRCSWLTTLLIIFYSEAELRVLCVICHLHLETAYMILPVWWILLVENLNSVLCTVP